MAKRPAHPARSELDVIELSGLSFDSVIGVYPSERHVRQKVELDVSLYLDTRGAVSGRIEHTVDYARLSGELKFLMHACRFVLLETAAEALCRYILAPPTVDQQRAQVLHTRVRLGKPAVLTSLTVTRAAGEYDYAPKKTSFGMLDAIFLSRELGIYRARLRAGQTLHQSAPSEDLILGSALTLQGRAVAAGRAYRWPGASPRALGNPSSGEQTVLTVARPRFSADAAKPAHAPATAAQSYLVQSYYPAEHAVPHDDPAQR